MTDEPFIVKPVPGRYVLHPKTGRPIKPDGQDVRGERGYFHRLLQVGDVVIVPNKPPRAKKET